MHAQFDTNGKEECTHASVAEKPDSQYCTACGDTSHILLPLADLLKAVASSLQNQTGHAHAVPETAAMAASGHKIEPILERVNENPLPASATQTTFEPENEELPEASEKVRQESPHEPESDEEEEESGNHEQAMAARTCEETETSDEKEDACDRAENDKAGGKPTISSWINVVPFLSRKHDKDKEPDDELDQFSDEPIKPKRFKVWHGLDGIAVMTFGVVLPALILGGMCTAVPKRLTLILLNHPVETIVQLCLLALVPLTNFALWSALRKDDVIFSRRRGIALGSSLVTSLSICAVSLAALWQSSGNLLETEIGTNFESGFTWLAVLSFAAAAAGCYIVRSFQKTCDFASSRRRILTYTLAGSLLTLLTLVGSEAKNWYVRVAERMAVSTNRDERARGLELLRPMFAERDLRMECTDSRAAGLCGLFIPLKSTPQKELYFRLTGRPFSFKDEHNDMSAMPDDYIMRHAVGDKVSGLTLARSEMSASVRPNILTTTVDWTFVLDNASNGPQQARTELSLPQGAVVTEMTEWVNGQKVHGTFTAGKNQQDSSWSSANSSCVTDLGHGRALLRCSEIQAATQLKMAVKMIVPLKPESMLSKDGMETASLVLPKLIATNYSVDDDNAVQIYSPLKIASDFSELKKVSSKRIERLAGTIDGKRLESAEILVTVERPEAKTISVLDRVAVKLKQQDDRRLEEQRRARHGRYAPLPQQLTVIVDGRQGIQNQLDQLSANLNRTRDKHGLRPVIRTVKPLFLTQSIARAKNSAPRHLLIVVDGSESMKQHVSKLKKALTSASIPVNHVDLMIASQDKPQLARKVPLASGLSLLEENNFAGGQNNLKTVIDAAEEAGSAAGGAVLWIHGPQPVSSGQIYITTPYAAHPSLYELPIENGEIDTAEFFKNHSDIGEFVQVSHKSKLDTDIACFFKKWRPDNVDYVVSMSSSSKKPEKVLELKESEGKDLLLLNAHRKCMELLSEHKDGAAARIAVAYGVLTPVSSLVIEPARHSSTAVAYSDGTQSFESTDADAPSLQGATNGTLGPQGADATFVCGVNTAGTVRVNNLANLEALLNILANVCEIGFLVAGIAIAGSGLTPSGRNALGTRIAIGIALAVIGLGMPGCVNWLVASARDANLFS